MSRRLAAAARHRWDLLATALVAMLAFAVRFRVGGGLVGLRGMHQYDDGVYFAAATAFVHGRMPYADFRLLHPPGIVVLLTPFAELGRWVGDANAMVAARAAFMVLGALNAVLVFRLARRWGRAPAVFAGLAYALSAAAAFDERVTNLEAVGTTTMLGAVLALQRVPVRRSRAAGRWTALLVWAAGILLALGALTKIWNAVPVLVVLAWFVYTRRGRALGHLLGGLAAGGLALVAPFAVGAGSSMWRMVVLDQLGRATTPFPRVQRLIAAVALDIRGSAVPPGVLAAIVAAAVLVAATGCAVLAWRAERGRLWVVMVVAQFAVLIASPSFYANYAAFVVAALILVLAAGGSLLRPRPAVVAATATCAAFAVASLNPTAAEPARFPAAQIAAALPADGCVRADSPGTLALAGVLSRDLDRGCVVPVDLSGFAMDVGARDNGRPVPRAANAAWRQYATDYLSSGSSVILTRSLGNGFDPQTERRFDQMHVVVDRNGVRLLIPDRQTVSSPTVVPARDG